MIIVLVLFLRKYKKEKKMIKLGQTVKEVVTGIEGIAMARTEYYTGCIHIGISPREPVKENGQISVPEWVWVDETRCVVIDENILQLGQPEIKDSVSGSFPHAPSN
jgi:hypothetical protein